MMQTYKLTIKPLSAFGTPLKGDTLFGQLCWAAHNRLGETRLNELLQGYCQNEPFAVVSDAFPCGFIPRPSLPGHFFTELPHEDRKAMKKRIWMSVEQFHTPLAQWLVHCRPETDARSVAQHPQPHNTLNRYTGTTGTDEFAPYAMNQLWFGDKESRAVLLDIYLVLDEARMSVDEAQQLFRDIGLSGFGRDASIGLGKFEISDFQPAALPEQNGANTWLTLAPCAPQGLSWQQEKCFYQPFTRFGRHGDAGVHRPGGPFKAPVLLAQTGAVLTPQCYRSAVFTGQGLGGDGQLSHTIHGTVHQGYAPVMAVYLPREGNPYHD